MTPTSAARVPTGLVGLDELLGGGIPRGRVCLVQGNPGSGKTTLGLQFLLEGKRRGEACAYITLSEPEEGLREVARSHGWSLDGIALVALGSAASFQPEERYTIFHPSEIELGELTRRITLETERIRPARLVIDSLSEYVLLARDRFGLRRQLLGLAQLFAAHQATTLFLRETESIGDDIFVQSLVHGVIHLEQVWPVFGGSQLHLRVVKMRGMAFRTGYHDYSIETGGITVFPRIQVAGHRADFVPGTASTGEPGLDALLGGGLDRGTSVLVLGPTGVGKSVVASQVAAAAADRGERVALFVFDEVLETPLRRADGLGLRLREHVTSGIVRASQIDPGALAPWEFARMVLEAVERDKASMIVIDSLDGYLAAMPDERSLHIQLHELFACLAQLGVITVSTLIQHGLVGERLTSPMDLSHLTDTVIQLRFFEHAGEVRRAVSVIKRRHGGHELTIRELHIGPVGLRVGPPLTEFQGVLTGQPTFRGGAPATGEGEADEPTHG